MMNQNTSPAPLLVFFASFFFGLFAFLLLAYQAPKFAFVGSLFAVFLPYLVLMILTLVSKRRKPR